MNIVILGLPGSGKGTQARVISQSYNLEVVDTGKLLRGDKNLIPSLVQSMDNGNLLSDEVVIGVVESYLLNLVDDFILDGFPRTIGQARSLLSFSELYCRKIGAIIKMLIDDEIIIQRLSTRFVCCSCGAIFANYVLQCNKCASFDVDKRGDDSNVKAIKNRIYQYKKEELILDNFFYSSGINVVKVEASGPVEEVTQHILQKLLFLS